MSIINNIVLSIENRGQEKRIQKKKRKNKRETESWRKERKTHNKMLRLYGKKSPFAIYNNKIFN